MQAVQRNAGQSPQVKIYNAVYSSVQVYECMVRGIAVMRRRGDSFVNATQILKVAGIEKGRRTKILEKEILPGKHEIVQGGYGKYQGTWIPLERGRDIAAQYGVAPLLAPLFDFTPSTNSLGSLPTVPSAASPRPLSAASSFPNLGTSGGYSQSGLAPPPIMPGSALRLLNQGRAQGLFTPSTSSLAPTRPSTYSSTPYQSGYAQSPSSGAVSPTPPPMQSLKRARSDSEVVPTTQQTQRSSHPLLEAPDIQMSERSRPPSVATQANDEDGPSPAKRARKEPTPQPDASQASRRTLSSASIMSQSMATLPPTRPLSRVNAGSPHPNNAVSRPPSISTSTSGKMINGADVDGTGLRFSTKPNILRDPSALRDARHMSSPIDVDTILDDKGHTALHLAASMGRQQTVSQLISAGADIHRGNFVGETPLMRASIDTHNFDQQCFNILITSLHPSIRTLDTSRKSVLHHIMYLAGIHGRAVCARYYLDQIFLWIAQNQGGDFKSIVDLQDEYGDTALNIAARVGNRSLVRTLLDVGANRVLPNKLGLRPGDFGVEVEVCYVNAELSGGARAEDIIASLHMTSMIQELSTEFSTEIKAKQDSLDVTQAHLRAATRELSEQRKQIQLWQSQCGELDKVHQRIRNLEKAFAEEDHFDWTGRTDLAGRDGRETAGPAFQWRGPSSTMTGMPGSMDISFSVEAEPPSPTGDSVSTLMRLRRLKLWHMRMEELMQARLRSLQGASAEKEYQCKKVVALCTGIPIDKVEDMLENLVVAVESEAQVVDIVRVAGFMQKVRDGLI
ncbi:apses-domain-containing protein [Suillus paluster]|uniref:apses-domain-containing protein n=1 Tax=Suillus paluster TaxID=48578 RepID=UPI001B863A8F|nr:apses-domain-containing protein [Suillus paluster]KAG1746549.1 apses-domain-containing protein [Suillus paluster]